MADKENQHFVPQYYFRFFSENKKSISLLNRATGKTVATAPIRGQASKSYFYGDAKVEGVITEVESSFIAGLRKISSEKDFGCLSENEVLSVLQAVMFQRSRTLAKRKDGKKQQDQIVKLFAEIAINKLENISEEERQEYYKLLDFMSADPVPFQGLDMAISIEQANHLLDLKRIVIKNRTKYPFIFSDAPVVMINPFQQRVDYRGVLGMVTPGLIIILPLSPRIIIMFIDHKAYNLQGESKGALNIKFVKDVDQLNKLQILNSSSAVYFGNPEGSTYVYRLWSEVRRYLDDTPKGMIGEALLQDGEDTKEVIHIYDRQLPLMPSFSFLKYEKASRDSHLIDRARWDGKKYY